MAIFGLVLALPGAAFGLASVRAQLALDVEGQARLLAVLFSGFLLGTVIAGPLADHIGLRPVLAGATLAVAVGLAGLIAATGVGPALLAVLLLGIGGAGINTSATTLVSGLYPERRSAMLTWLALACALGGMTLPLLVLAGGEWTLVLTGAAAVATIVAALLTRVSEVRAMHAFSWRGLRDVVAAPAFGWYLAMLVCQGGNEAALAGWLTPHLTSRGMSGAWALTALTCHWLGIIVGRFCMAVVVERVGTHLTIAGGAIVASLGTGWLIVAQQPSTLLAAAAVAGVGISGVFSVVMADAGARYRARAGTMFAALIGAGQIGGMLIPWSVGRIAERTDVGTGLLLIVATTLAVSVIMRTRLAQSPVAKSAESAI